MKKEIVEKPLEENPKTIRVIEILDKFLLTRKKDEIDELKKKLISGIATYDSTLRKKVVMILINSGKLTQAEMTSLSDLQQRLINNHKNKKNH